MTNIILLDILKNLGNEDLTLFQWHLNKGVKEFTPIPKALLENADRKDTVDKMVGAYKSSGAVKITLTILKKINQNQLAEELKTKFQEESPGKSAAVFSCAAPTEVSVSALSEEDQQHNSHLMYVLRSEYERILIGNSKTGHKKYLDDIYTDLIVVQNESGGVIHEHEVMQIEMSSNKPAGEETFVKCSELFKAQPGTGRRNRKVLTMGIAGVGKTVSVNKFILDWAKGEENQDIKLVFPLAFRELNLKKDKKFSLIELLNDFFFSSPLLASKLKSLPEDDGGKVLFIFDGLDECRFSLQFEEQDGEQVKDVNEKTSVGSLITNLIKKHLLPFALIWVTCRPAAAHLIPRDYIDLVTEVQGFNDEQKKAYFSKCCSENVANKIVSHIMKSRSLHVMCQIPVFCRISATVLQPLMNEDSSKDIPTNLTGMYMSFLLQQINLMKKKYSTVDTEHIIKKLGELAFHNLESGDLNFYEEDLTKCGINVNEGTIFSGMCTQIFDHQDGISERNIFSFVHLSVQESLAALHVHQAHCNKKTSAFKRETFWNILKHPWLIKGIPDLHKCAVEKALQSKNGHLDLFLRFLLGISLKDNQKFLNELLPSLEFEPEGVSDTVDFIKKTLRKEMSTERSLNLLHCLNELKDNSLTAEIQRYLDTGVLSTQTLSSSQWSALVFVLLMSEESQETFELKKYRPSDEGMRRLLPVVKNTKQAILASCNLGGHICENLGSVLNLENSLKQLDLSDNDLQDSGVELLSAGLKSSHCKLEILRLSGCMVTKKGCSFLASALSSNPSHLKELDVTYNHPEDSGVRLLTAKLEDPHCKLDTLRVEHGGMVRIKPGIKKWACDLTLDPNTAHHCLSLSEGNRKVVGGKKQSYPHHEDRFDVYRQVMSKESLTGRCYWEAEWNGGVGADIALVYKPTHRKGTRPDCVFGWNERSWSLDCCDDSYSVYHNSIRTDVPPPSLGCRRIGVYVDCPAGTLSFYSVSSDAHMTHLHTFNTTFTEPLYAGFYVWDDSLVSLCEVE